MKTETVIQVFKKVMENLGYKGIDVRPSPEADYEEGDYQVGFLHNGQFEMDIDLIHDEIVVERKPTIGRKKPIKVKVPGFVVTGYKTIHATRWEPADVDPFTITSEQSFQKALHAVMLYYVHLQIDQAFENAYYDEMESQREADDAEAERLFREERNQS